MEIAKRRSCSCPTHLVNTGMNHILLFSPNTCSKFLRKPTLNPFLSGPLTKTGAEKASETQGQCEALNLKHLLFVRRTKHECILIIFQWQDFRLRPHPKWICSLPLTNNGNWRGTWDWQRTWVPRTWGRGHEILQARWASPPRGETQDNKVGHGVNINLFKSSLSYRDQKFL